MDSAATTIDWSEALNHHRGWMLRLLRARIKDWHAAEDLIQEIAVMVLRQSALPTDPQKVAPWLYQLTVRQAVNHHRRSGRKKNQIFASDSVDGADAKADSPLDWIISMEQQAEINHALSKLRSRDREILQMKYGENWTYEQIAEVTGAKLKTIEYRLMRARQELRRQIINRQDIRELSTY
ncbi:MAG: RNA polymerase sigma factor [Pirellulaceae bacterium]|jgi:RNA polymerase sigma factor (sigma-70 family)|nr:RNA polymerase sigma factor [Pirellulaceae bacterium]